VAPVLDTDFDDKQGNFVFYKEYFSKGSLKDVIYHVSTFKTLKSIIINCISNFNIKIQIYSSEYFKITFY